MHNDMSGVGETMTGYELDGRSELALFTDSQDLAHLLEEMDRAALDRAGVCAEDVTALLLDLETPDGELWAAETRYPGSLKAFYTRIR
ncbi:hypothetical protein DESA109040_22715 [Deinococcus saxicola]|uniref:hypothetical protein n=1 Tax=Deinococcus saxicola TaxID=249406 RepID=UPI0039EFAEBD